MTSFTNQNDDAPPSRATADENMNLIQVNNSNKSENNNNNDDDAFADPTSNNQASWLGTVRDYSNVYRQFFGTNVLTMGWSMMVTGFVVGPVSTFFVAILEYRAILSLLRVKNHFVNREQLVAFGQVGEATFGSLGSWIVDFLVILCQWLGSIGYAAFGGHNFEKISGMDYKYCVIISVAVSLIVSLFQAPFFLAKLSLFTNLVMFSGVIIIFSQLNFGAEAASKGEIELWTTPLQTMIGLTSLATSLGGITVTLDVERTMKHSPGRYHTILQRMIIFAVLLLIAIGLLSYGSFRKDTQSVLSLSLDEGAPRKAAETVLVIGPMFESVLNSFQMFVIVEDRLKKFPTWFNPEGSRAQWVMMRVICYVTVAVFAIFVPWYGLITAVNGAFGYGALAFLIPPLMELKIIWDIEAGRDSKNDTNNNMNQQRFDSGAMDDGDENVQTVVNQSSSSSTAALIAQDDTDRVSVHRKVELFAILILGGAIIGCGGFAAIRQIVENESA